MIADLAIITPTQRWLIGLIPLLLVFWFLFPALGLYIQARVSGAPIGSFGIVGLYLRKAKPRTVVTALIQSTRAGLDIPCRDMEIQVLAGGDLMACVNSLIAAKHGGMPLTWDHVSAADLVGKPVFLLVTAEIETGRLDPSVLAIGPKARPVEAAGF
ncbi:MAG: flotillin-like FloA family protein [Planctomycetota bacterium]